MTQTVDLVVSGGSIEGICRGIGFLKAVLGKGYSVDTCVGNSAGSLVLGMWACGKSTTELESWLSEVQFTKYVNTKWFSKLRFLFKGHLSNGKKYLKMLREQTHYKCFKDLDINLRCVGWNKNRKRLEVFDKTRTPNMEVALAIRISTSLPGGFRYVHYQGDWYADGGIEAHYPIHYLSGERNTLGLLLGHEDVYRTEVNPDAGILSILEDTISDLVDANVHYSEKLAPTNVKTWAMDDSKVGTFDFNLDVAKRKQLVDETYTRVTKGLGD